MRAEVPFQLVGGDQPLIVVQARFNGSSEPLDCALDTGASHAMLLPEVGARLKVVVKSVREGKGAAGPVQVQVRRADSIALDEAVVRDVPLLMTNDLRRIGNAIG